MSRSRRRREAQTTEPPPPAEAVAAAAPVFPIVPPAEPVAVELAPEPPTVAQYRAAYDWLARAVQKTTGEDRKRLMEQKRVAFGKWYAASRR